MDQLNGLFDFIRSKSAQVFLRNLSKNNFECVIGVPCYGNKKTASESICSLMSTLESDSLLIVSLEGYTNEEAKQLCNSLDLYTKEPYGSINLLVVHHHLELKLINHWNFLVDCALLIKGCKYFAWGSDHDLWSQNWYAETRAIFEANPDCLLAVPQMAIQPYNQRVRLIKPKIEKRKSRGEIEKSLGKYGPGNSVYGLFSIRVFELGLRLNHVLLPDRLLLSLIALWQPITYGEFLGRPFWTRIELQANMSVLAKQRKSVLSRKLHRFVSYFPWTLTHLVVAFRYIPRISRVSHIPKAVLFRRLLAFEGRSEIAHRKKQTRNLKRKISKSNH